MAFFSKGRQSEPDPEPQPEKKPPQPTAPTHPIGFETVVGTNCKLEGTLSSSGNIRLDGTFIGTLDISGNVLVGETAKIEADVHARNISIAGAVRGNVRGKKVQLLRTGRIWGDIQATALTTEEGAFIDGKITMTGHDAIMPDFDEDDEVEVEDEMVADDFELDAELTVDDEADDDDDDVEEESESETDEE